MLLAAVTVATMTLTLGPVLHGVTSQLYRATCSTSVSAMVAVLYAHATVAASEFGAAAGRLNPGLYDVGFGSRTARADQVLLVVTLLLIALAAVNAVFVSWATVRDSRHASAVIRTAGATVRQVAAGLSSAQVIPALAGAVLGIPGGIELFMAASHGRRASARADRRSRRHPGRRGAVRDGPARRPAGEPVAMVAAGHGGSHPACGRRPDRHSRPGRRPAPRLRGADRRVRLIAAIRPPVRG